MKAQDFLDKISKKSLNYYDFMQNFKQIDELRDYYIDEFELFKLFGIDIIKTNSKKILLKTAKTKIADQIFTAVDIECSAPLPDGQIIEIAGVKFRNFKIIDKFQSLIKFENQLNSSIEEITHITQDELINAPRIDLVMDEFKNFLGTSVFVAHNAKFDYGYISATLEKLGLGFLLNRRICTIDLSQKVIQSPKYGLSSLKELLNINTIQHRAMPDAMACMEIFNYCLEKLDFLNSTEELIDFSKSAKPIYKN